ncbi:MAG: hypothetical protein ACTSRS_09730 [Candidatus Helarchaeota archaeon]
MKFQASNLALIITISKPNWILSARYPLTGELSGPTVSHMSLDSLINAYTFIYYTLFSSASVGMGLIFFSTLTQGYQVLIILGFALAIIILAAYGIISYLNQLQPMEGVIHAAILAFISMSLSFMMKGALDEGQYFKKDVETWTKHEALVILKIAAALIAFLQPALDITLSLQMVLWIHTIYMWTLSPVLVWATYLMAYILQGFLFGKPTQGRGGSHSRTDLRGASDWAKFSRLKGIPLICVRVHSDG